MNYIFRFSFVFLWLCADVVCAQTYPTKPIRLIVPFAPGGGTDIIARLIGLELTESMGQALVIDNRGGSGGVVGVNLVAKADPDGHTIGLCSLGFAYAPALYAKLPYDTEKDFAPITVVATQPFVFTAHPSLAATNMKELIALVKAKPGQIHFGSGGAGGAAHLGTELLKHMTGTDMTHVPYKGTGPALTAMIGGEIQIQLIGVSSVVPHLKSGRLRVLAVGGSKRSPALPDAPTVIESGIPGYVFDVWYGMLAPARTPSATVAKLNTEINRALKNPVLAQRFAAAGLDPAGGTSDAFEKLIRSEIPKWRKVVAAANIKVD
ncbi:MAG: tripartite tricarboxylate transporter substrate binding protein [Burkholderiales bacterium]